MHGQTHTIREPSLLFRLAKALGPRACVPFAVAAVILYSQSAWAIMATPTDKYQEAPAQMVEALMGLRQTERYLRDAETKVRFMEFMTENETLYIIVRFESANCPQWCPNTIFKGEVSSDEFVAIAVLPRKSALGTHGRSLCKHCEARFPLVFFDDDSNSKAFFLTEDGLIF